MQGFSAMLVEEVGPTLGTLGQDLAHRISHSAQFMDALLSDLLTFSRISQEQIELVAVNLEPVVQSALALAEHDILEKNGAVSVVGRWPAVLAHAPTLRQALFNLLSNALKFVAPGSQPVIKVWAEEREPLDCGAPESGESASVAPLKLRQLSASPEGGSRVGRRQWHRYRT